MSNQPVSDTSQPARPGFCPGKYRGEVNPADWSDWRWQLANRVSDPGKLLVNGDRLGAGPAARRFPMLVTPYYLSLAREWGVNDPVFRQIMPSSEETAETALPADGLGETQDSPFPGLIHRYPDRVLVLVTGECAVLCRHCFRKRLWKQGNSYPSPTLEDVKDYVARHPEVKEVILSGGDALLVPDDQLFRWLEGIGNMPQIQAVRVASRLPVVLPQRLTGSLCKAMAARAPVWMMTQFNHPAELTAEAVQACASLVNHGIPVLNQTVLLKGVNDEADILARLFQGLVAMRVKPHYLLHGDPIAGTGHFRTGIAHGLAIMKDLRGRLSSLATPTFAIDLPEGGGKVALAPEHRAGTGFETIDGRVVDYF